ncbi:PhnD/SsuA/transferrin family substrate-binding protein [Rhodoferax sp.]|uniref:substrate-binding domain-containing protein n=1 Tax=Rhodoferax sp. TaxID=50421 RepID=UPI0026243425|nr:PhnD/SsuA/transferrin family substrate-binding protein [Rhodoferax sp.]MDD2926428.1 PhnD/SsuA/transferrin family substrate-binding protein [Rhodoferax sp.]
MLKLLQLLFMALWLGTGCSFAYGNQEARTIRFAMTPAFLHDQHALLAEWRVYLESRLKRPVEFIQRDRYRDTMDLLQQQKVEFAWICDYPYVMLKKDVRLLAVAMNEGKPTYRSYLIVPTKDTQTHSVVDLKGGIFAYADPHSNTGYLVPRFEIRRSGADPATFFRRTFFTWSHRKVIDAVAAGLVRGGMVDSYVWDVLNKVRPDITAKTRIAWRSEEFGFPPIVAHSGISEPDFVQMQNVITGMSNDSEGRALLARLKLNGFVVGSPRLYNGVADMMRVFGEI